MLIRYNLGTIQAKNKDWAKSHGGIIRNDTCRAESITETEPAELLAAIERGQSFTPAAMTGKTGDTWQSQQMIIADIDNKCERILTPDDALQLLELVNITPYCMYYTLSNPTAAVPKYRIVLILEEVITDGEKAIDYTKRVIKLINDNYPGCTDEVTTDNARLFFGSYPGGIFYRSEQLTSLADLEALEPVPDDTRKPQQSDDWETPPKAPARANRGISGRSDTFDLLEALDYIPADDYEIWIKCGMSLKTEGYTLADWENWSRRSAKYEPNTCGRKWDSFDKEVNGGYITNLAKSCGYIPPKDRPRTERNSQAEQIPDPTTADIPPTAEEKAEQMQEQIDEKKAETMRNRFINVSAYLDKGYKEDITELQKYAGRKIRMHANIEQNLTLYPGLAALGGQASLGKTTFCVNMVMDLLKQGEHVLYFALEQRPEEIITKSVSNYIYTINKNTSICNTHISKGKNSKEINNAITKLKANLVNYHVIECDFETTAADIEEYVMEYMKNRPDVKPIVVIDYLQLIAPPADFRGDTRSRIDENLKSLKKLQKDNGLFMLLVSSFNRSSNLEPISYESFKETSMIEFTCDYVFGLQLQIQDANNENFYICTGSRGGKTARPDFSKKALIHQAQSEKPKKVQFVCIKNRRGKQYFTANFNYYPAHDYFEPSQDMNYKGLEPKKDLASTVKDYNWDDGLPGSVETLP